MNEIDRKIEEMKKQLASLEEERKQENQNNQLLQSAIKLLEENGYQVSKKGEAKIIICKSHKFGSRSRTNHSKIERVEEVFKTQTGVIKQKQLLKSIGMHPCISSYTKNKLAAIAAKYGWQKNDKGKGSPISYTKITQSTIKSEPKNSKMADRRQAAINWLQTVRINKPLTLNTIKDKAKFWGIKPVMLRDNGWATINRGKVTYYYPIGRSETSDYRSKSFVVPNLPVLQTEITRLLQNIKYAKRANLMLVAWNNTSSQNATTIFRLSRMMSKKNYDAMNMMCDETARKAGFIREVKPELHSTYKINAVVYVKK